MNANFTLPHEQRFHLHKNDQPMLNAHLYMAGHQSVLFAFNDVPAFVESDPGALATFRALFNSALVEDRVFVEHMILLGPGGLHVSYDYRKLATLTKTPVTPCSLYTHFHARKDPS